MASLTTLDVVHLLVWPEAMNIPHSHCYIYSSWAYNFWDNAHSYYLSMLYERPPTFRWNKRCGFSASFDCRPESTSKFIIACIFACHLQSTGCRFTERKNCRKRSGQSGWTAGVTGNLIRAYNDPSGSDPLAESIRRIVSASGSDPPPDQFY